WEFVIGKHEDVSVPLEHIEDKWDSARFIIMFASHEAVEGEISWNWFANVSYRRKLRQQINHTVLNCTRRRRTGNRHLGATAFGLSEASLQSYIHQSSYKRQT
ncbi:TPA: hypothetical protein ACGO12_002384, partial [Streptococcus suis]